MEITKCTHVCLWQDEIAESSWLKLLDPLVPDDAIWYKDFFVNIVLVMAWYWTGLKQQYCLVFNWALRNKSHRDFNKNTDFIQQNVFENVVCKMEVFYVGISVLTNTVKWLVLGRSRLGLLTLANSSTVGSYECFVDACSPGCTVYPMKYAHRFVRRRRRATPHFFSTSCYLIRMT